MITVCVDPGIRGSGLSTYYDGRLSRASYVVNPVKAGNDLVAISSMAREIANYIPSGSLNLVVERPLKVWGSTFQHLLPLLAISSGVYSLVWSQIVESREYFPAQWKGTGDAQACTERVRRELSTQEFSNVVFYDAYACEPCMVKNGVGCEKTNCLMHNVYDSIGLGLKFHGRFEKKRVIRR